MKYTWNMECKHIIIVKVFYDMPYLLHLNFQKGLLNFYFLDRKKIIKTKLFVSIEKE